MHVHLSSEQCACRHELTCTTKSDKKTMNVIAHSDLSITVILHQCSWLVISDVLARISNVVLSVDSNQCHFHLPPPLIITGSIPEQDGDRIYNTCTVYGPNGDLLTTYRKV